MRAGFIGLGAMGGPMAGHLHARGLLAAVGNRNARKAVQFAESHDGVLAAQPRADFAVAT
jgi:3-hydroxyisobutyrate dehydrogenase